MFKFSLGSLGAFPIFDDLVSQKRLIVEQNTPNFGAQGQVFSVYGVLLTVKCSISVWGSFGTFPIFDDIVHVSAFDF